MTDRERRLAENEAAFRDLNESLRYVAVQGTATVETMRLVCECGDAACSEFIEVGPSEYESVRAAPTHFIVHHDHVDPRVEHVVLSTDRFVVVAKEGDAAREAVDDDPRT